jgi:hypothetical protein
MYQRRSTWTSAAVLPLPPWHRRLHPSPAKLPPEVGAVVTFVSGQASWALARSALRSRHLHPIYNLKPYGDFRYIGGGHQESQGQPITFGHQMYGAPFTFPAVGDILASLYVLSSIWNPNSMASPVYCWDEEALQNHRTRRRPHRLVISLCSHDSGDDKAA